MFLIPASDHMLSLINLVVLAMLNNSTNVKISKVIFVEVVMIFALPLI
jgi:hypothetical protein